MRTDHTTPLHVTWTAHTDEDDSQAAQAGWSRISPKTQAQWDGVHSLLKEHGIKTHAELAATLTAHKEAVAKYKQPLEGVSGLEKMLAAKHASPHQKTKAREIFDKFGAEAARVHVEGLIGMPTTPVGHEDRGEPQTINAGPSGGGRYSEATNSQRAEYGMTHGKVAYEAWKAAG